MAEGKSGILQGTLDLMVLKTLDRAGSLHGYGIARHIEQVSEKALAVNQGTMHLCLTRLLLKRWIAAGWGISENNRRAKYYSITNRGKKQLAAEIANWRQLSRTIGRLLDPSPRAVIPM